jgi:hypothetical protein
MKITREKGKEPPEILAELISKTILGEEPKDDESSPFTLIEEVIFKVNELPNGMLAAFNPKEKNIVMDLGNCLVNQSFMKQGLMWISSIWFNLLFAFYHELGHVIQVEGDPKLADKKPTKKMEKEADEFAIGCIKDWTKDENNELPTLDAMGWIGNQIKKAINMYYPAPLFDTIYSEIKPCKLGAVGGLDTIAACQKNIGEIRDQLSDDEKFGIVVDGIKYMKAEEFFGAIYNT